MKPCYQWLCLALVIVCAGVSFGDDAAKDPIHAFLFPPDLLMRHRQAIGLTDQQVQQIHTILQEAGPNVQQRQQRLGKAMAKLGELLSVEKIDEQAAAKQLDEVLAIEKDLKQLHLRLMIRVRNQLTAPQRQTAKKLHLDESRRHQSPKKTDDAESRAAVIQQRLQAKIARIQKEVQSRAEAGQPPFEAVEMMHKFPQLMKGGQVKQAEALLDRVIKSLGLDKAKNPANKPERDRLMKKRTAPARQRLSPQTVCAEVEALKKEDVAWRKIAWKTCLLDGLKASREQKKPIMLWVFIDRPIDDERC